MDKESQFIGFDAYKKAIAMADVVILTTPPGFRPMMFEEAIAQGKHVFMEKPVATDAAGVNRVLAAANGAEAVSQFREHSAEVMLLITDQSMPVMDGARAIATIRETRADLPVIVLSGDGESDESAASDGKPVERLFKPVELEALLRAVSQALA